MKTEASTHKIAPELADLATPIGELRTFDGNPRRGNVDAIAGSLEAHGQYRPIVARLDGEVLAGNHTLLAAQQLGWTHVAVTRLDVDDEQAKRIVLADNRTADLATYDDAALLELLASLNELEGTGWDDDAIAALEALLPKERHSDPDEVPEPPTTPISKPGSLWLLGRHRILCGDSTSPDDVTRLMDGERARLMATDPPYLVDYDGGNHPQSGTNRAMTKDKAWDDYHEGDEALYADFLRVAFEHAVESDAPVYQWHAMAKHPLVAEAWQANGLLLHQTLLWVKSRPVLTRSDFMWQHEPCLYGWRRGNRPATQRRPPSDTSTVWHAAIQSANDIHPTEKPVELFTGPLSWHLKPAEVAYEPFSGSGTQIVAAEMQGRSCYAMELAPQYVDVAARRWQEHTGEKPINAETGEPVDFTEAGSDG